MQKRMLFILTSIAALAVVVSATAMLAGKSHGARRVPAGMAIIPGGVFNMGMAGSNADEAPVHAVKLAPFLLDRYEVTNRQFAAFIEATDYVTQAERDGYAWGYLKGTGDFQAVAGASWRHPEGPASSIDDRMDHPVVCVSWEDAAAYAKWAGKRLPTEAEWEYAARGGSTQHFKAAFNETNTPAVNAHHEHATMKAAHDLSPSAKSHRLDSEQHASAANYHLVEANFWQGTWPTDNQLLDGFYYTAPVGRFTPNDFGVYDVLGNVWEWTADWYAADYYQHSPAKNPTGAASGENRVARGGSWFCSPNYCGAYNTSFRGASPPNHTFNNVGFRCAADL
ncbi:hypothetical protein DCC62_24015 [candidate division KSB1 bacterium]|nr:formylglycine-generating enzyme family protein [Cytophagia bacterium CHB2]RIK69109.1 MAG: hypothetical protein DCC62_24015 [candidate division KSB1 bacterium]